MFHMTSTRVVLFLILANKNLFIQKSSQFYVISPNTKYGNGLVFHPNDSNSELKGKILANGCLETFLNALDVGLNVELFVLNPQ